MTRSGPDLAGVPAATALPTMVRVRQQLRGPRLDDVTGAAAATLRGLALDRLDGRRVAVAVGSRASTTWYRWPVPASTT